MDGIYPVRMSLWLRVYSMFFFFFQAEDGIRDYKVTGVQTCALPILTRQALENAGFLFCFYCSQFETLMVALSCRFRLAVGGRNASSWANQRTLGHGQIGRASCRERV